VSSRESAANAAAGTANAVSSARSFFITFP
jgi:hypothetical protein